MGSGLTKVFIWLQYVCWVLNHIFEILIALCCLVPPAKIEEDYLKRQLYESVDQAPIKQIAEARKLVIIEPVFADQLILDQTHYNPDVVINVVSEDHDDFSFSVEETNNELNIRLEGHKNNVDGKIRRLVK